MCLHKRNLFLSKAILKKARVTNKTARYCIALKVPKHENFSLAFFALSEPIWACDLGTGEKIEFFYQLSPDFDGF